MKLKIAATPQATMKPNNIELTIFIIIYICLCILALKADDAPCRAAMPCRSKELTLCDSNEQILMEGKFGKECFCLCLKHMILNSSPLITPNMALLLEPEADDEPMAESIQYSPVSLAYGFPIEDPQKGSAEGYIGDDGYFYGILHIRGRTLYADPYDRHTPEEHFGAYEGEGDGNEPRLRRDHSKSEIEELPPFTFPYVIEHKIRTKHGTARGRICELLLLADKEFYENDANSSLNQTVRRMVHALAQADIIFRNTDFDEDGIPDNIGFSIKYILVLTSEETNSRLFGDLLTSHEIDGRSYLLKFARLRRLSEVCLGVAFSGHAFHNRTLGLSFTSLGGGLGGSAGGLCDRRAFGRSFNTLVIAHSTDKKDRVPERLAALTLAHEIGHSFGAHHDDKFPDPDCHGYLMSSQSSPADNPLQYEFSKCSRRLIAATLNSMSYCLKEQDGPYCGNGVVEENEDCDCGLASRCSQRDPCCTPRAGGALIFEDVALHKDGCTVAPGASCHPSQGMCCGQDCRFADLSKHGIVCDIRGKDCSQCPRSAECRCGMGGRCSPDGGCHAAECARLHLAECECPKKGPGGAVGEAGRCGVCCKLRQDANTVVQSACVGAEFAARSLRAESVATDWPDPDYRGPNVSMELCEGSQCKTAMLRAWSVGNPCVSMNRVGVCSARGVCKPVVRTPRSNIYPIVMRQQIMRNCQTRVFCVNWTLPAISMSCLFIFIK